MLTAADTIAMLAAVCEEIEQHKSYLSELDRGIGDGDHGVSMSIGCRAIRSKLPDWSDLPVSELLTQAGMTFLGAVGASVGPLYGTAMIRAGQCVKGKEVVTDADFVAMWEAALRGIQERGKAQVGDKTMVDAIAPAVRSLRGGFDAGKPLADCLQDAAAAAQAGMESTRDMVSRIGRSSRLGDRSRGQLDPGAASGYLIIQTVCATVAARIQSHAKE